MWVQRLIEGVAHFSFIFGLAPRVAFDRVLKYDVLGKIKSHTQKKESRQEIMSGLLLRTLIKDRSLLNKIEN